MWRAAACDRKNTDLRFTSSTASQSASVKSMALVRRMMPGVVDQHVQAAELADDFADDARRSRASRRDRP